MPSWTSEQLHAYEQRQNSSRGKPPCPVPEPAASHEPVAAKKGKDSNPKRFHVRVVSYRRRLCDADNLCPKYFIDCLKYAEIVPDDSAKYITLEVSQEKSKDEQTLIEITPTL